MAKARTTRRHGSAPAYWRYREGRPRWDPGKDLRAAGWKARDLKDKTGAWLSEGASIDAARAINAAVQAWKDGEPVDPACADIAPGGAAAPQAPAHPLDIGVLHDAFLASDELNKKKDGTPRPKKTVDDYRKKLKRLIDALAGYATLPAKADAAGQARYAAAVARIRAATIFTLEAYEHGGVVVDPLYLAHKALRDAAGLHMAYGTMAVASVWLTWCRRHRSRKIVNWAKDVERETPPGRVRPLTWPEIAALVAGAQALSLPHVGDAVVLAVDLGWSEIDVLGLTWARVITDDNGAVRADARESGRQKTGRKGGTPFCQLGLRRLAAIRERNRAAHLAPLKVIHIPRKRNYDRGDTADSELFRKHFALVRAHALRTCPSCASVTFADTRDTGFTLGRNAGLSDDQTASRTLQSRRNIKDLGDRHYGEIGPEIADQARAKLDVYIEGQLVKHGVKL